MAKPKIIIFDLETLPNLPEALKIWPQLSNYPGRTLKATVSTIICAGWKYYESKTTHCINAWDFSRWKTNINDDLSVVRKIYHVLKDADAVVTHNGKRFDWKFLQTRLLFHRMPPLHKIKHIDTVDLAKRNLYSFNNRLGYLGEWLVGDKKMEHEGWNLWVKTHGKDPKAMKIMADYCKQDVNLLEKVFKVLRPFATDIPNHNLYLGMNDKRVCSRCGSKRIRTNGYRETQVRVYQRLRCRDCGGSDRTDARGYMPRAI